MEISRNRADLERLGGNQTYDDLWTDDDEEEEEEHVLYFSRLFMAITASE